jgi:hypothetical protein
MLDPFYDNITDRNSILEICRYLVASRTMCRMEFPETRYVRITSFLDIVETEPPCLLVDTVPEIESNLQKSPEGNVLFEFRDAQRVPCQFATAAIWAGPEGFLVEVPPVIQRMQKRQYFRVDTPLGSQITFTDPCGEIRRGTVTDVSGQGVSFIIETKAAVKRNDVLTGVELNLPAEEKVLHAAIPRVAVRRVEPAEGGRVHVAVTFSEIAERVKREIITYIFERHRSLIRKIGG